MDSQDREAHARHPGTECGVTRDQLDHWREFGYVVLPGFFMPDVIDPVNELIERMWADPRSVPSEVGINANLLTRYGRPYGDPLSEPFRDVTADLREHSYKINCAFFHYDTVRRLSLDPELCSILSGLLGGTPMAIHTLNFERGSEQTDHVDTYYMPGPVTNSMVATWIALEDVHPDAGPLRYWPGSVEIPPYRFAHGQIWDPGQGETVQAHDYYEEQSLRLKIGPEEYLARKGDVFVWHSQLFHGGSCISDVGRTRKSLVTHYFRAEDYDLAARQQLDQEEKVQRLLATPPAWRPRYLMPTIEWVHPGGAYLTPAVNPAALQALERLEPLLNSRSS